MTTGVLSLGFNYSTEKKPSVGLRLQHPKKLLGPSSGNNGGYNRLCNGRPEGGLKGLYLIRNCRSKSESMYIDEIVLSSSISALICM